MHFHWSEVTSHCDFDLCITWRLAMLSNLAYSYWLSLGLLLRNSCLVLLFIFYQGYLLGFYLFCFWIFSAILGICFLSDIVCMYFYRSVYCLFNVITSFSVLKIFSLKKFHLSIYDFVSYANSFFLIQKPCPFHCSETFPLSFVVVYGFRSYS